MSREISKTRGMDTKKKKPLPEHKPIRKGAEKVYTITFCDMAENHAGMQQVGDFDCKGYSMAEMRHAREQMDRLGLETEMIDLNHFFPKDLINQERMKAGKPPLKPLPSEEEIESMLRRKKGKPTLYDFRKDRINKERRQKKLGPLSDEKIAECIREHTYDDDLEKNWNKSYRINICGNSAHRFVKEIGFCCESMKEYGQIISESEEAKSQASIIPGGYDLILQLKEELKDNNIDKNIDTFINCIINKTQVLRNENLNYLKNGIPNISKFPTGKIIEYLANNYIMCDPVTNIIIKENVELFDIEVTPPDTITNIPEGRDFIAGLFINHNSQGMTLDALEVDIGNKIFAAGQAYTALSRARNLKSIKVIEVSPDSFITRKSVIKFYKKLEIADDKTNNKEKEMVI